MILKVSAIVMGMLYIAAGLHHFRSPALYESIMPHYLPAHRLLVIFSGVAEIVAGLMVIIPSTRHIGAWAAIAILIAVFPANLFMAQNPELFPKIPRAFLYVRLPLQLVLIGWAYLYTNQLS